MQDKTRRRLLQGVSVMLPAAWTRPIIESVILPAHAEASVPGCSAPAGCYAVTIGENGDSGSFSWQGGGGVQTLDIYGAFGCESEVERTARVVLADSLEAAQESAGPCPGDQILQEVQVDPETRLELGPPEGCNFYVCTDIN